MENAFRNSKYLVEDALIVQTFLLKYVFSRYLNKLLQSKRIIFVFLVLLVQLSFVSAQPNNDKKKERAEAKAIKNKKRNYDTYRKMVLKRRFEMQTPEVQKSMKNSRRVAANFNRQGKRKVFRFKCRKASPL